MTAVDKAPRLPAPPTSFVGREAELAEILRLLRDPACRLLTLVGPGGMGKTRLAIQAAARLAGEFEHGVAFVNLLVRIRARPKALWEPSAWLLCVGSVSLTVEIRE